MERKYSLPTAKIALATAVVAVGVALGVDGYDRGQYVPGTQVVNKEPESCFFGPTEKSFYKMDPEKFAYSGTKGIVQPNDADEYIGDNHVRVVYPKDRLRILNRGGTSSPLGPDDTDVCWERRSNLNRIPNK